MATRDPIFDAGGPDDPPEPGSPHAGPVLHELDRLRRRSSGVVSALSGPPLIAWGLEWVAVYAALDLWPPRWSIPAAAVCGVLAVVISLAARSRQVHSGWERRLAGGWCALMAASPLVLIAARVHTLTSGALTLGAVMGIGLILYGLATSDRAAAGLGALVVGWAAVCSAAIAPHPMLWFGVVGGLAMAALGGWRLRGRWRR